MPLIVGGYALCQHCLRASGATPAEALQVMPGLRNWRSKTRHLLRVDEVTTFCNRDTNNPNWEEPWQDESFL